MFFRLNELDDLMSGVAQSSTAHAELRSQTFHMQLQVGYKVSRVVWVNNKGKISLENFGQICQRLPAEDTRNSVLLGPTTCEMKKD